MFREAIDPCHMTISPAPSTKRSDLLGAPDPAAARAAVLSPPAAPQPHDFHEGGCPWAVLWKAKRFEGLLRMDCTAHGAKHSN